MGFQSLKNKEISLSEKPYVHILKNLEIGFLACFKSFQIKSQ